MAAKKEARRYLILDHVERIREADVLAVLLRMREYTGETRSVFISHGCKAIPCLLAGQSNPESFLASSVDSCINTSSSKYVARVDIPMRSLSKLTFFCRLRHGSLPHKPDPLGLQCL